MEDPNYEQTDIFSFMRGKSEGKRPKPRTKKAALAAEQKHGKTAACEEASLFGEEMTAKKKPARAKKASPKKAAPSAKAAPHPKEAVKKEAGGKVSEPPRGSWREKLWEFDITHPSQDIKDTMKEALVAEGFMKREANRVSRGFSSKKRSSTRRTRHSSFREHPDFVCGEVQDRYRAFAKDDFSCQTSQRKGRTSRRLSRDAE